MIERIIDAKTARKLTKRARKNRPSKEDSKNFVFIRASEIETKPIRQEDYEVDWGKAIKQACEKGVGCAQVWAPFVRNKHSNEIQILSDELRTLGYDFYHHDGPLYRIRWM